MRPVRLDLAGFGSLGVPASLDFTDVNLYAVIGSTGAEASTLVDALCLALYGTARHFGTTLTGEPARVSLVFDVDGQRYRALRDVRRGGGPAGTETARLERLLDSTRIPAPGEVATAQVVAQGRAMTPAVVELVGLEFDHFRQLLVLLDEQIEQHRAVGQQAAEAEQRARTRLEEAQVALGQVHGLAVRLQGLRLPDGLAALALAPDAVELELQQLGTRVTAGRTRLLQLSEERSHLQALNEGSTLGADQQMRRNRDETDEVQRAVADLEERAAPLMRVWTDHQSQRAVARTTLQDVWASFAEDGLPTGSPLGALDQEWQRVAEWASSRRQALENTELPAAQSDLAVAGARYDDARRTLQQAQADERTAITARFETSVELALALTGHRAAARDDGTSRVDRDAD